MISKYLFWLLYTVMAFFVLPALKIFANFRVYHRERTHKLKSPFIAISNHRSYLDPYAVGASFGLFSRCRPIRYISEDKLFSYQPLAALFYLQGACPAKKKRGLEKSLKKPLQIIRHGGPVGFFVEGGIFKKRFIHKPRRGAVALAQMTRVPIVPMYIEGAIDLGWLGFFSFKNRVRIIHGRPFMVPTGDITPAFVEKYTRKKLLKLQMEMDGLLKVEDEKFWDQYGKIYKYLERARPYKQLVQTVKQMVGQKKNFRGHWLDVGSGSGAIIKSLIDDYPIKEILATDYYKTPLKILLNQFKSHGERVKIRRLDLRKKTPFDNNKFDDITANLVFPYITHFEKKTGLNAQRALLKEMYRILRPGGILVWSTPVPNVKFSKVFIDSIPDMVNSHQVENIIYGPAILHHAHTIAHRGRNFIYHFLDKRKIKQILTKIGFRDFKIKKSFSDQVNVIYVKK